MNSAGTLFISLHMLTAEREISLTRCSPHHTELNYRDMDLPWNHTASLRALLWPTLFHIHSHTCLTWSDSARWLAVPQRDCRTFFSSVDLCGPLQLHSLLNPICLCASHCNIQNFPWVHNQTIGAESSGEWKEYMGGVCLSIYLSIYLFIHPSIHPSIQHTFTYLFMYLSYLLLIFLLKKWMHYFVRRTYKLCAILVYNSAWNTSVA